MKECICGSTVTDDFYRLFSIKGRGLLACPSCMGTGGTSQEIRFRSMMPDDDVLNLVDDREVITKNSERVFR